MHKIKTLIQSTFHKRSLRIILIIVLLLILVIALVLYFADKDQKQSEEIDVAQLESLMQSGEACNEGLEKTSSYKTDPEKIDESISLLSYRWSCSVEVGRYEDALSALEELKGYFQQVKDKDSLALTNDQIDSVKSLIKNPPKPREVKKDISKEELQRGLIEPGADSE